MEHIEEGYWLTPITEGLCSNSPQSLFCSIWMAQKCLVYKKKKIPVFLYLTTAGSIFSSDAAVKKRSCFAHCSDWGCAWQACNCISCTQQYPKCCSANTRTCLNWKLVHFGKLVGLRNSGPFCMREQVTNVNVQWICQKALIGKESVLGNN